MVVYKNLREMQIAFRAKVRELRKSHTKSSMQAAKFMVMSAIAKAPRKTGETIQGITMRQVNAGWRVSSTVPGKFKQNLWANQTAPFRTLHWPDGGPNIKPGTSSIYGVMPDWNWTGMPRFFHIATLEASSYYKKVIRENTKIALRATI
jgi:hypothetical protein